MGDVTGRMPAETAAILNDERFQRVQTADTNGGNARQRVASQDQHVQRAQLVDGELAERRVEGRDPQLFRILGNRVQLVLIPHEVSGRRWLKVPKEEIVLKSLRIEMRETKSKYWTLQPSWCRRSSLGRSGFRRKAEGYLRR